jgi:hypothetical protein
VLGVVVVLSNLNDMEVKNIITLVSEACAVRADAMNLHTFWVTALVSS